jgi:hypothetical protein
MHTNLETPGLSTGNFSGPLMPAARHSTRNPVIRNKSLSVEWKSTFIPARMAFAWKTPPAQSYAMGHSTFILRHCS